MSVHVLENEKISAVVAEQGAELISLFDKEKQRELLWQADAAYWNRHAPVLFPNVGKHYGGSYLYKGKRYPAGQHGFARDMKFTKMEADKTFVSYRLSANKETEKTYPFLFQLDITHRIEGNRLTVQWEVKNQGENIMYFTIGGHPAFRVPILGGTKFDDYFLYFEDAADNLEYVLLDTDSGTAIAGKRWKMALKDRYFRLRKDMFDKDALIFDGGQIQRAALALPDGVPYIAVESKGFPNFGIWSKPGAPYVCLEPWCGRCDDRGFEKDISEKPGINALHKGEVFQKSYDMIIY